MPLFLYFAALVSFVAGVFMLASSVTDIQLGFGIVLLVLGVIAAGVGSIAGKLSRTVG